MSEHVRDLQRRDRLGWRLMGITLLLACAIGMLLNIGQILVDSRSQSAEIDRNVQRPKQLWTPRIISLINNKKCGNPEHQT